MKNNKKIFLVLVFIVLLPALFFSFYQISTFSETESLIETIYVRQLDAILFSVNQHVLDVASSWASQAEEKLPSKDFATFFTVNPSIQKLFITDTTLTKISVFPSTSKHFDTKLIEPLKEKIDRLFRYRTVGYRKLEPMVTNDSSVVIMFVPTQSIPVVMGIVINKTQFINEIVAKKLTDLSTKDFVLAVTNNVSNEVLFSTHQIQEHQLTQRRSLWVFPEYSLGIGVQGETLGEIAQARYYRNLALIVVLDIVLVFGVFFVYRTIKREMELVAMKSDFVSNVSHELRTPLSLIRMFVETLEMKRVKSEKKKQEYYGIILRETERLTRLINNILNFSRMESSTRKFRFQQADINLILSSVMAIYSYQLEQLQFVVKFSLEKNIPLITIDEEAISEALHNVIDNAIKYSAEKKFLGIRSFVKNDNLVIEIEDHGIGIPAEVQSKIFDKFYRVSQGLVHTAKGSGLGLTIVRYIIESHQGSISVNSNIGNGSTFTITLPLSITV